MSATIAFNPWLCTNAENSFSLDTTGITQGFVVDDPVLNTTQIAPALVSSSNSAPLIGGWPVGISFVASGGRTSMQKSALLATSNSAINGFTTTTYAENGLIVPGSDAVPQYLVGGTCNYIRLGSNIRLSVQASQALLDALYGGSYTSEISWNFTTNMADVYSSTTGALPIKNIDSIWPNNSLVATQVDGVWKDVVGNAIVITI